MTSYRDKIRTPRSIRVDDNAVLGLPLNLLIMVVIAAVAIGIILSWLFLMTPPLDYIEVNPTMVNDVGTVNATFDVTVTAYNKNGPMSGCEISIEGAGIDMKAITGDDGSYTFTGISPTLPPNTNSDFISVSVSGGGNVKDQGIALNK